MDIRSPPEIGDAFAAPAQQASVRKTRLAGYTMVVVTAMCWGINWPVQKQLIQELPPLVMRGAPGLAGAVLLAIVAVMKGQSLRVPRDQWARLVLYGLLSVSCWMALIGLALVYLTASETAVVGATMPVWAAALAWPVLGERITLKRVIAMTMAIGGLVVLMGGNGVAATEAKLPGIALALMAAFGFALGAVLSKRKPLDLPPLTAAVWQVAIGCFPVALAGMMFEQPHFSELSHFGWALFSFAMIAQICIGYACWYGALERLPASTAAIGTLLVPVIGVLASAISLGEPLGVSQVGALVLTVAGVAIASRS